jgi:hypothetical protein
MAIPWAPIPEGTRVKVKQSNIPQDPMLLGKTGTVVAVTEYQTQSVGVALDESTDVHYFTPAELEITTMAALPADREAAKQRRSLP